MTSSHWWKPVLMVVMLGGLVLLGIGLRRAADWVDQGRLVATAELPVPGAPPWELKVALPEAGRDYLLESAVTVQAPQERGAAVTLKPELRLFGPRGERIDQALQAAGPGRTTIGRSAARLVDHWWLRPFEPGEHRLQMVQLGLSEPELTPSAWSLRVAADAPREPGGRAQVTFGFVLAMTALVLLVATARPRSAAA